MPCKKPKPPKKSIDEIAIERAKSRMKSIGKARKIKVSELK